MELLVMANPEMDDEPISFLDHLARRLRLEVHVLGDFSTMANIKV